MDEHSVARVQALFIAAKAIPPAERQRWVVQACRADDGPIIEEVLSLLAADLTADGVPDAAAQPPPAPAAAEAAGSHVGRYKLLEQIGEGGFGVVFRAEQVVPVRREMALKVIKLGMDTREVVARFEAERQALALMDSPNIAKVFDAGATDAGRPYFVMELVRGLPVTQYADKHKLSTRDRVSLAAVICRAVHHAHTKGVIHRDIKPSNVLVGTGDGDRPVPKVIDFGIAKATQTKLTDRSLFTPFRQLIGTPQYMSPEQADTEGLDVDTRSDVYSLGVVLYELLVGTTPLDARSLRSAALDAMRKMIRDTDPAKPSARLSALGDTLATVATNRATDPDRLRRQVHGELDWIVMRALEKDRSRRYDTAAALADDLGNYLDGKAVVAGPTSRGYRVRKWARQNRVPLGVAAAVGVALLLGVAGTTAGLVRERAERQRADRNAADAKRQQSEAERSQAEAEHQTAVSLAQAAVMAEGRGDWAAALRGFRAADVPRAADRAALLAGQLRAADRLGSTGEAAAVIRRAKDAGVADDPRFRVVRGIYAWPTAVPADRATYLRAAIRSAPPGSLPPGDRAFAEALLADDYPTLVAKLTETVAADPFNRDARTVLVLADWLVGDLPAAEAQARILAALEPADAAGPVLLAITSDFAGRPAAARATLAGCTGVSAADKRLLADLFDVIDENLTLDRMAVWSADSFGSRASRVARLTFAVFARLNTGPERSMAVHVPVVFERTMDDMRSGLAYVLLPTAAAKVRGLERMGNAMPNGSGSLLLGVAAAQRDDWLTASRQYREAANRPSMIDCRRYALAAAINSRVLAAARAGEPLPSLAGELRPEFQQLLAAGGIRPPPSHGDQKYDESSVVADGLLVGLTAEARALAYRWYAADPTSPKAVFYLLQAEHESGHDGLATAYFDLYRTMGKASELYDATAISTYLRQPVALPSTTRPTASH